MRHLLHGSVGCFAALFLVLTDTPTLAGGLVDTSPDRFAAADFTSSEFITNPWWTLSEGDNFLYFAREGRVPLDVEKC